MLKKIYKYLREAKIKKNVKIGKNCRIITKYKNFGSEPYLIKIGDNCTIAQGVIFITHDGSIDVPFNANNKSRWVKNEKYEKLGRIIIEDNCFVGINSIIMPNVRIGKNSIVGAGSIVTKSVPEGVIVAGNPARVVLSVKEYSQKIEEVLVLINQKDKKNDILNKLGR